MMIITYTVTGEDYLANSLYSASHSKRIKKQRLILKYIFPLVYLVIGVVEFVQGKVIGALLFAGIALLWLLLYPIYDRKRYVRFYRGHIREQYKEAVGQVVTVEIHPDHLLITEEGGEARINTSEIAHVSETGTHFFLKLKGPMTLFLPKTPEESAALSTHLKELAVSLSIPYHEDLNWAWK